MEKIRRVLSDQSSQIVIAGIGNVLRNDDGIGPYIVHRIRQRRNCIILVPETGIERYISVINKVKSDLIILIDCVDFGKHPGYWDVISIEKIAESTCHSHNISLRMLHRFLYSEIKVIGIQPSSIEVGEHISEPVMASALEVIEFIDGC
jgi:hydrogenase 3 maturation protease